MTETRGTTSRGTGHAGRREVHHGRTPAAWAGVTIAFVGLLVIAAAMFMGPNMTVFWVGIALVALALVVTAVMRKLGYGADG
ncbi:hypothetical protein GCM10009841_24390 [Microlunatus panaciterrae]|uniref:Uncharacterized protein (DUF983 family) n=1 Tax=Microlunatus panaciterrae TaxID=400768 RepID=A0ABS2REA5_9ACTN|nr:HGxxPAAW family protein [Microlunatus panaciterrae]MBM7797320.1 uncharacterized protein (DUF983 family) [Microlunatus panaciterrae]